MFYEYVQKIQVVFREFVGMKISFFDCQHTS